MKWIEYQVLCNKDKNIFIDKKIEHTEANLAIAKSEAYNGQYYITEDEKTFEKKPVEIELGGTNAKTAEAALINLGAVSKTEFNQLGNTVSEIDKEQKATTRLVEYLHRMEHGVKYAFEDDSEIGYAKDVPSGAKMASLKMIGGMTRKCGNLIRRPYDEGSGTVQKSGVTFTVNADGSVTANGTASADVYFRLKNVEYLAGVSYYLSGCPSGGGWGKYALFDEGAVITDVGDGAAILKSEKTGGIVYIRIWSGVNLQNVTFRPMLNPGTTAMPYEPYFEGLRSAKVESVESVGVQLWDEVWETGYIDSNGNDANSYDNRIRSVNYIRCLPDTYYRISGASVLLNFYDSGKNFILQSWFTDSNFYTPSNCYYIRFATNAAYGGVYKNNIMLNAGEVAVPYASYVKHTLPIPAEVRAKPWYGLGISKDVRNAIRYNEDSSRSGDVRCVVVDLGTPNYTVYASDHWAVIPRITRPWSSQFIYGQSEHISDMFTNEYGDIVITYVGDFADAAAVKAALSGVMLVYELATPTTEDISDILTDDGFIDVEGHGTLTFVNEHEIAVPNEEEYLIDLLEVVS